VIYQRAASGYTGVAAYYARAHDCPMIWHVASDMEVKPFERRLTAKAIPRYLEKKSIEYGLRNASHVVVQTRDQRRMLKQYYGRTDAKVIRNFHPAPREKTRKNDQFRVLWIANLKPIKQPEVFLRLARRFAGSDCQFVMVGGPSTNKSWQRAMDEQIAGNSNVEYLGQLSQGDVNEQLARSHVLVNTSHYEGFSNTFVQAWMRGVLVVSLNVNPDGLLDDGRMGYCAHGSFDRLVGSIAGLAKNRALRETYVEHAISESRRGFSMRNADALVELIDAAARRELPADPLRGPV
jgi:glycosyltransferase involved in cell wall biosynthesis